MDPHDETYLGDGVYASFDGYQIWLKAARDGGGQHRIALDQLVFDALVTFGRRIPVDQAIAHLKARIVSIADDFQPDGDADAPQALQEMREALKAALEDEGAG